MSKYVILNPTHGGSDTGKVNGNVKESDYTLKIAEEISRELNQNGIANKLLRTGNQTISREERINKIVKDSPDSKDTIVLSIGTDSADSGIEIIYALRNTDKLASTIATNMEDKGYTVSKYYSRRLPENTSQDYYDILRETGKRESLIVDYGNLSDASFLENNWQELASITAKSLENYLGTVGNFYTVKQGDSLYGIASKYGTTVDAIKRANNLGTNMLSIGQKLLIPEVEEEPSTPTTPPTGNVYTVKSGDTLYSIAGRYGITVDSLKNANGLTSNNLKIGQKLTIPSGTSTPSGSTTYTVKSGDTLYGIASKYGVSVDEIKRANGLSSNILQIGQKLTIPNSSGSSTGITYTVKKGDNLYNIAQKYNVTVDDIKRANGLTTNLLQINQILKIPNRY